MPSTNEILVLCEEHLETAITNGFAPLYFFLGIVCGILFINLFKGRWFI